MGAPDVDPPCSTSDQDCISPPSSIGPSDGTGPGLVINANLIMGNAADAGSGGGVRLQHINGTDVLNFPNGLLSCLLIRSSATGPSFCAWNSVSLTNNIIANNVAGWDGAGISLLDGLAVNMVNNTVVSNDTTASSGVLFNSLFAGTASAAGPCPVPVNPVTGVCPVGAGSAPQPAGLVSVTNSAILQANLPTTGFSCPFGHGTGGACRGYSIPLLSNDVFWQNRTFFIGVAPPNNTGPTGQQSTVTLFNSFTGTPAGTQASTGACPAASYWDIGVRGDTGPTNHNGGLLHPTSSVLTNTSGYPGNSSTAPTFAARYCNGSRVPPEFGGAAGWQVPPGTIETNGRPHPVFSLTPSATVDEGNNWINLRWGPLSSTNPITGARLGNYGPAGSGGL